MFSIATERAGVKASATTHRRFVSEALTQNARSLARYLFQVDVRLGREKAVSVVSEIPTDPELVARSLVAILIGDPIYRGLANEQAALALIAHIQKRVDAGTITHDHPLATLTLTDLRDLSRITLEAGFNYLGGKDVV